MPIVRVSCSSVKGASVTAAFALRRRETDGDGDAFALTGEDSWGAGACGVWRAIGDTATPEAGL